MPDLDIPKDPTSPARSTAVLGHQREVAGERAPPEARRRPRLGGWVGVDWGEWSLCWVLPSFPSLQDPSHCSSGCARLRLAKAPTQVPRPSPAMCPLSPGAGGSQAVLPEAAGCWDPSRRLARGKCRFFTRLSRVLRVSRKARSRCPLPLLLPAPAAPGAEDCGAPAAPPGGDPNSLPRAPFSWRPQARGGGGAGSAGCAPLPVAGPPRAPGELGQRPRDAGAVGLPAPAPQLAGPAARGGRGGGGERCALLETRC